MDVMEKLVELLSKYFDIGDSYYYNLTRTKNAFACGTMGFDDFEEFDDETVADIANHLITNGVTIHGWIPVTEGMPEEHQSVVPGLGTVSKPVLVTWLDPTSDKPYPDNCFVREGITRNGEFTLHHINGELVPVAWMPQPKPYQQPSGVSE